MDPPSSSISRARGASAFGTADAPASNAGRGRSNTGVVTTRLAPIPDGRPALPSVTGSRAGIDPPAPASAAASASAPVKPAAERPRAATGATALLPALSPVGMSIVNGPGLTISSSTQGGGVGPSMTGFPLVPGITGAHSTGIKRIVPAGMVKAVAASDRADGGRGGGASSVAGQSVASIPVTGGGGGATSRKNTLVDIFFRGGGGGGGASAAPASPSTAPVAATPSGSGSAGATTVAATSAAPSNSNAGSGSSKAPASATAAQQPPAAGSDAAAGRPDDGGAADDIYSLSYGSDSGNNDILSDTILGGSDIDDHVYTTTRAAGTSVESYVAQRAGVGRPKRRVRPDMSLQAKALAGFLDVILTLRFAAMLSLFIAAIVMLVHSPDTQVADNPAYVVLAFFGAMVAAIYPFSWIEAGIFYLIDKAAMAARMRPHGVWIVEAADFADAARGHLAHICTLATAVGVHRAVFGLTFTSTGDFYFVRGFSVALLIKCGLVAKRMVLKALLRRLYMKRHHKQVADCIFYEEVARCLSAVPMDFEAEVLRAAAAVAAAAEAAGGTPSASSSPALDGASEGGQNAQALTHKSPEKSGSLSPLVLPSPLGDTGRSPSGKPSTGSSWWRDSNAAAGVGQHTPLADDATAEESTPGSTPGVPHSSGTGERPASVSGGGRAASVASSHTRHSQATHGRHHRHHHRDEEGDSGEDGKSSHAGHHHHHEGHRHGRQHGTSSRSNSSDERRPRAPQHHAPAPPRHGQGGVGAEGAGEAGAAPHLEGGSSDMLSLLGSQQPMPGGQHHPRSSPESPALNGVAAPGRLLAAVAAVTGEANDDKQSTPETGAADVNSGVGAPLEGPNAPRGRRQARALPVNTSFDRRAMTPTRVLNTESFWGQASHVRHGKFSMYDDEMYVCLAETLDGVHELASASFDRLAAWKAERDRRVEAEKAKAAQAEAARVAAAAAEAERKAKAERTFAAALARRLSSTGVHFLHFGVSGDGEAEGSGDGEAGHMHGGGFMGTIGRLSKPLMTVMGRRSSATAGHAGQHGTQGSTRSAGSDGSGGGGGSSSGGGTSAGALGGGGHKPIPDFAHPHASPVTEGGEEAAPAPAPAPASSLRTVTAAAPAPLTLHLNPVQPPSVPGSAAAASGSDTATASPVSIGAAASAAPTPQPGTSGSTPSAALTSVVVVQELAEASPFSLPSGAAPPLHDRGRRGSHPHAAAAAPHSEQQLEPSTLGVLPAGIGSSNSSNGALELGSPQPLSRRDSSARRHGHHEHHSQQGHHTSSRRFSAVSQGSRPQLALGSTPAGSRHSRSSPSGSASGSTATGSVPGSEDPVDLLHDPIHGGDLPPLSTEGMLTLSKADLRECFDDPRDLDAAFKLVDLDGDGQVTKDEFLASMKLMYSAWSSTQMALLSYGGVSNAIAALISALFWTLIFITALGMFEISLSDVWLPASTMLLSFSFAFGSAIQRVLDCLIFVLVITPYEVGDRVSIPAVGGGNTMVVSQVNVLTSEFVEIVTSKRYIARNADITGNTISNHRRTSEATFSPTFVVDHRITAEQITTLREVVLRYIRSRSLEFKPNMSLNVSSSAPNRLDLTFYVTQHASWQEGGRIWPAISDFTLFVGMQLQLLGIAYLPPSQRIEVASPDEADRALLPERELTPGMLRSVLAGGHGSSGIGVGGSREHRGSGSSSRGKASSSGRRSRRHGDKHTKSSRHESHSHRHRHSRRHLNEDDDSDSVSSRGTDSDSEGSRGRGRRGEQPSRHRRDRHHRRRRSVSSSSSASTSSLTSSTSSLSPPRTGRASSSSDPEDGGGARASKGSRRRRHHRSDKKDRRASTTTDTAASSRASVHTQRHESSGDEGGEQGSTRHASLRRRHSRR